MRRLRLLKVIVQPVFVIDDGEQLIEQSAEPVVVPAVDWETYPVKAFAEGFELLRREVESNGSAEPGDESAGQAPGDEGG